MTRGRIGALLGLSLAAGSVPAAAQNAGTQAAPAAAQAPAPAQAPKDPYVGSIGSRSTLTGDWGGTRAAMGAHGYGFSFSFTQFGQGLVSGSGEDTGDYSGVFDVYANIDLEKAGLWKGGGLGSHIVSNYGEMQFLLGRTLLPVNTTMLEPQANDSNFEVSSLYLTQKLSTTGGLLMLGKLNSFDLLAADPFMGGWGVDRFMNVGLAAPVSGLVPPIIIGGAVILPTKPATWTFIAFDPNNQWGEWGDRLFQDGVNVAMSAAVPATIGGLSGSHTFGLAFTTRTGADLGRGHHPREATSHPGTGVVCGVVSVRAVPSAEPHEPA